MRFSVRGSETNAYRKGDVIFYFFSPASHLIVENIGELPGTEAWIVETGELKFYIFDSYQSFWSAFNTGRLKPHSEAIVVF